MRWRMLFAMSSPTVQAPHRRAAVFAFIVFILCLGFNIWGVSVGWRSLNLPGHEFRQAQTALTAFHIKQDHVFSLDYTTPVLGKPWAIPFEFPLYQWTVVVVSDWSGLGLIKSGRVVSLACFYLMLPAIFLLLGNLDVARGRRWLVLALVVTSPLYIFYSRAFMIETMALMFSLWFWVAFERAIKLQDRRWLLLANLAGLGAGLVKVTTFFVYMLPAACRALHWLWQLRHEKRWRSDVVWMTAAVALPLVVTFWWGHHADAVRSLNPLAHFLVSNNLVDFAFGTWTTRFSSELWMQKWQTTAFSVTWWPVLVAGLILAVFSSWDRLRQGLGLAGAYLIPLLVFPVLYGFHDYYFVANGVLLLTALGLILVGVAESNRRSWLPALLALILAGGQAFQYGFGYYETQRGISRGGNGLTESLHGLVKPDEVIVIVGQQWNPMLPFYTQRRAMMIREEEERNPARLDAAFAELAGEKIGALAISSSVQNPAEFLKRTSAFGIAGQAIFRWRDVTVYLRGDDREESVRLLQKNNYQDVTWVPGVEPQPERLAGEWVDVARLAPAQRDFFASMNPAPKRFFCSYGPAAGYTDGLEYFGAHPVTRLVFALSMGARRLQTKVSFNPDTYSENLLPDQRTDGVEITLTALIPGGPGRVLYSRLINPRDKPEDRGLCELDIPFTLERDEEVELFFGPGPAGRDTYDSISMGPLLIE